MATAIEFENIGKQYRLGLVSTQTLSHDLNRWWQTTVLRREDPYLKIGETNDRSVKGSSDYVWALRDINFKVEQGDVVGIIGRNGAGKSTMLKLLSKVTAPTTGVIRARGRIGSLLEVGTGFYSEMTGRENIFMNGAILGMTKAEINRKLDEIVDFSGCERYLDTPVKRYSSGMIVRLGFAVAAHLDPEILVVDEVLAVGDAEFQKKAIGKMKDVSTSEGRTVLFVSHNMAAVRSLCRNGVVLSNGMISMMGTASNCIEHYLNESKANNELFPLNNVVNRIKVWQEKSNLYVSLSYKSNEVIFKPNLGIVLSDSAGNMIFGSNPVIENIPNYGKPSNRGVVTAKIEYPILVNGRYYLSVWFNDALFDNKHFFAEERCLSIEIIDMNKNNARKEVEYLGPIVPIVDYIFENY